MNSSLFEVILLTLKCSLLSMVLVFIPGIPLAYCLARTNFPGKKLLSTLVGLPLVIPPTAVGFLLLKLLSENSGFGSFLSGLGIEVILTWKAVVIAGAIMSTPLVIRTAVVAFEGVSVSLEELSWTLGYKPWKTFFYITLPLAYKGILAAFILGFTRAMGEFGATVILAGNIPGQTQTLASAIFSAQQTGNEAQATTLITVAIVLGFAAILLSEYLSHHPFRKNG